MNTQKLKERIQTNMDSSNRAIDNAQTVEYKAFHQGKLQGLKDVLSIIEGGKEDDPINTKQSTIHHI